ncbi:MAG: nucleoside-triphosphatase, partial [Elusimicrobiota bacterium]
MRITIVTGPVGSGKTTRLQNIVSGYRDNQKSISGIVAPAIFKDGHKVGYDVVDINSGKRKVLARTNRDFNSGFTVGKYNFSDNAFDFATDILNHARAGETVFLDEAGPLELKGKGYAGCIEKLLKMELSEFYVVVRKSCL